MTSAETRLIYLDTSFLVSLYSADANSAAAIAAIESSPGAFVISPLTELEAVNALQLRVFRMEISQRQADASLRAFDGDLRNGAFLHKELPAAAFERARRLSRENTARLGTRTADLLHIAIALELGAPSFFSFDLRQRKVALGAGLIPNPLPLLPRDSG